MKLTIGINNSSAVSTALTKLASAFGTLQTGKLSYPLWMKQKTAVEKKVVKAVPKVDDILFGALLIGAEFESSLGLIWEGEALTEKEGKFIPRINCSLTKDQKELLAKAKSQAQADWNDDKKSVGDFGSMLQLKGEGGARFAGIPSMEGAVDQATGKPKLVIGAKFEWKDSGLLKRSSRAKRFLAKAVDPRKRLIAYCKDNKLALSRTDGGKTLTNS
jgi:hypothetical protein